MTTLSSRHAWRSITLLALASHPIVYHLARQPVHEDCADPDAFISARRLGGTRVVETSPALAKVQALEGRCLGETAGVRVARVVAPGEFMASPLDFGFEPQLYIGTGELRRIDAGGTEIPSRWHDSITPSRVFLEAYSYMQGGRATSHPLGTSAPLLWDQLLHGTRPLTVLIVGATGRPEDRERLEREMTATLAQTWQQLDEACRD